MGDGAGGAYGGEVMNRLFLSFKYSFYMAQSYLAEMMDDTITAANMVSIADDYHRQWCVESIQ